MLIRTEKCTASLTSHVKPHSQTLAKFHFILLFLVFALTQGNAQILSAEQQRQVDSLNAFIQDPLSHDTNVAWANLDIGIIYHLSNPDTAILFCKKTETISEENNFVPGLAESYTWLGYLFQQKGDVSPALTYLTKSLNIFKNGNYI